MKNIEADHVPHQNILDDVEAKRVLLKKEISWLEHECRECDFGRFDKGKRFRQII
jgi:hypothetical protein